MDFRMVTESYSDGIVYPLEDSNENTGRYVIAAYGERKKLIWIEGDHLIEKELKWDKRLGVIKNEFYFTKNEGKLPVVYKASIRKGSMLILRLFQVGQSNPIQCGTLCNIYDHSFLWDCHQYFVEREDGNAYAIPINRDYRKCRGMQFNVSLENINSSTKVVVYSGNLFLFQNVQNHCEIQRIELNSDNILRASELPLMNSFSRLFAFDNYIVYMADDSSIVYINTMDLSSSVSETNLLANCELCGLSDSGVVTAQTFSLVKPIHVFQTIL